MFVVERPEELHALLVDAATSDPDLEYLYTLEPGEVAAITHHFDVGFDPQGRETCLHKWTQRREVPYLVHTGYELALMLEGRKQFARMSFEYPPAQHPGEDRFDRYVAQGLLHKEVEFEPFDRPHRMRNGRVFEGMRVAYYTRKSEEWRILAWKLVSKASAKDGWNDTFERLEGMLFGYEDWQNDWWIEDLRTRRHQFGTSLVCLAVTAAELAGIEHAGYRALPPTTRMLKLVSSFDDDPEDKQARRLLETVDAVALVRFRVKTRPFLDLVAEKQERLHTLSPDRIKDLNRLIVEDVEVVARR
jgi:hypothetical protein